MTIQEIAEIAESFPIFLAFICTVFTFLFGIKVAYDSFSLKFTLGLDIVPKRESFKLNDPIEGVLKFNPKKSWYLQEIKISVVRKHFRQPVYSKYSRYGVILYSHHILFKNTLFQNNVTEIPFTFSSITDLKNDFLKKDPFRVEKKIIESDDENYQYRVIVSCNTKLSGTFFYKNLDFDSFEENKHTL